MQDTEAMTHEAPLRLDAAWRLRDPDRIANVHTLRVVSGTGRQAPMDPDTLRTMVAEIVRDELRSELGRRMTASIRRFVKEEVVRIFARVAR